MLFDETHIPENLRLQLSGLLKPGMTHPGGSVTGGPGRNAAMVLLKDLGRDLNEVIHS